MNIVITGASRGIGFELVRELAADSGNSIIAISRNEEGLKALQQLCNTGKNNVAILPADISAIDEGVINTTLAAYGHVDLLINNAGVLINKNFADLQPADWHRIFEVNLFGAARMIQLLLPWMQKSNAAHIVNIGGMGGLQGTSKFRGLSAYSASKAALANLTECLAEEFKELNISVNCLALGSVNTEMLHNAFPGFNAPTNADEMARFIAWFGMHAGRLMNGKIVPVSINTP